MEETLSKKVSITEEQYRKWVEFRAKNPAVGSNLDVTAKKTGLPRKIVSQIVLKSKELEEMYPNVKSKSAPPKGKGKKKNIIS